MPSKTYIVTECPSCQATDESITVSAKADTFNYGVAITKPLVRLTAIVPVFRCGNCGETWTDWTAEAIREYVVEQYKRGEI